jgi:phosphatidylinositol alpha-mannosyltransferase
MSSKPLTIGMVSFDGADPIGGMGRHVLSLIEGLKTQGNTVCLFDRSSRSSFWSFGRNLTWSLFVHRALLGWIRDEGIDILHVHTGPGGAFLLHRFPIPVIVTANHTYAQQSHLHGQSWKKILVPLERRTYQIADAILCISEDTAQVLKTVYRIDSSSISVVPCGIDTASYRRCDQESRERYHVLFVGRPEIRKGWDLLLSAWEKVLRALPDATLHVVGFSDVGRYASIRFHGKLDDASLRSLLGSVGLVVCPSRIEGFGLIVAEALASGTPVVACDVAGVRRIVEQNVSGLLVSPDDASLADGILQCMRDDSLWNRLRVGAKKAGVRFDRTAEIRAHVALYDRVY